MQASSTASSGVEARNRSPEQEQRRLAALRRYAILDTPPDGAFDRITAMAAKLCDVPISIVSLVDHDRIWFKSHHGLQVAQIGRDPGLCASAILDHRPWVVNDARADRRALANPLVAGEFGLRFYVGVPLRSHDGFNLGTLCVIDREPRTITEQQLELLGALAELVMDQMELRLSARKAVAELSRAVEEKDLALERARILSKEIDHRVMNSLQLVSSLLSLQGRATENAEAGRQLDSAARRVAAVAQIHRHFYLDEAETATLGLSYLQRLCAELADLMNLTSLTVQGTEARVPTRHIVPLGLITHELVTNAVKHGAGRIMVSFDPDPAGGYVLRVADEGAGLPADFRPTATDGLGMKVVLALTRQIGGRFTTSPGANGQGVTVTIAVAS